MNNKYQDSESFYHDKPTKNGKPSSNNGFIYTAYSQHLIPLSISRSSVLNRYTKCVKSLDPVMIDRLPNMPHPVLSKDEVIGMVSLGLLTSGELASSHWNFCNLDSNFNRKLTIKSFFKAAISLFKIRKEHRNYFWENKMEETYPLAFNLPLSDRYYVNKLYSKRPSIAQIAFFYLNSINVYIRGDKSSRMILWLQMADLKHPLLRFIPVDKWVKGYFAEDHPFVKNLKEV